MRNRQLIASAVLLLGACSPEPADPARLAKVQKLLKREFAPAAAPPVLVSWQPDGAGSWVCGEIAAPASLSSQQSAVRFINVDSDLFIEPHLIPVSASDAVGAQIASESVVIFNSTWSKQCAPSAPIGRRLAGWFSWPSGSAESGTPLTNAYTDDLLRRAR